LIFSKLRHLFRLDQFVAIGGKQLVKLTDGMVETIVASFALRSFEWFDTDMALIIRVPNCWSKSASNAEAN
jgi:hypothetical protein